MGPNRDLIGELATAVRKQGLKFGVSNHGIENFQFVNPPPDLAAELKEKKAISTTRNGRRSTTWRIAATPPVRSFSSIGSGATSS